jgi:hypothetical protein
MLIFFHASSVGLPPENRTRFGRRFFLDFLAVSISMTGDVNFTSGDMLYAIGHGHLQNCFLTATVRKSDLQMTNLNITGILYDYYDFDVQAVDSFQLSETAAKVQAGFNPSQGLNGGHVFKTQVTLDKTGLPIYL